jgi:hypothetical protein
MGNDMVQENLRGIDPALDRDDKLAVALHMRVAGPAIVLLNLTRGQSFETFGGPDVAGSFEIDDPALVALPLSPADALELDTGKPDRIQYGCTCRDADNPVYRVEYNVDVICHSILHYGR